LSKADGQPQDRLLVEQRVEHPTTATAPRQFAGDAVDAALLGDVLAEHERLGVLHQRVAESAVQRLRERSGALLFGELLAPEGVPSLRTRHPRHLVGHRVVVAGRQGFHHLRGARQLRLVDHVFGQAGHLGACLFVDGEQLAAVGDARLEQQLRAAQQRIVGFGCLDRLDGSVERLDVRAGVPHQSHHLQVQERRATRASYVVDRSPRRGVGRERVEAVGLVVAEARTIAVVALDPTARRDHADPQAVVFAHQQQRDAEPEIARPAGGVDGAGGGRMVGRRIAEAAHHHSVVWRLRVDPEAPGAFDAEGHAHRLGKMRTDGRRLRWNRQRQAAEHLVPPPGDGLAGCRGQPQQDVANAVGVSRHARALQKERSRAVVQQRRVADAQGCGHRGVALVARRTDGVEARALLFELARLQIEMAALGLRAKELERRAPAQRAVRRQRSVEVIAASARGHVADAPPKCAIDERGAVACAGVGEPALHGTGDYSAHRAKALCSRSLWDSERAS
jgi:hypothetical protein